MARVRRTPEEARALILASARRLIAERGPDAVGLKDIAREAGVSHALVTHYFGTYDALVEATLAEEVRRTREALLARVQLTTPSDVDGWIELLFTSLGGAQYGRLAAWALLTGRAHRDDFFPRREKGMKVMADAIEARVRELSGALPFSREQLEQALVLVMSAGVGYALGGELFWASLGHEATRSRESAFRNNLASILRRDLLGEPRTTSKRSTKGAKASKRPSAKRRSRDSTST